MVEGRAWQSSVRVGACLLFAGCASSTGVRTVDAARVTATSVVTTTTVPRTTAPPSTTTTPSTEAPLEVALPDGVRWCDYEVGAQVADVLPEQEPPAVPRPPVPANTEVDEAVTQLQLQTVDEIDETVREEYVYPDFNGKDWPGIVSRYRELVEGGLTDEDFATAMNLMLGELGDDHSVFFTEEEAQASDDELAGEADYVGIGIAVVYIPELHAMGVVDTFANSPAERAGLRRHDTITLVDGKPALDDNGESPLSGPEGTSAVLTVTRPGEATFDVEVERARVEVNTPLDVCMVRGTRIAYVMLLTTFDSTIPPRLEAVLDELTEDEPLDGLVIDNRANPGGSWSVAEPLLAFFTDGLIGAFDNSDGSDELYVNANDVGGSQDVPLAVLVGTSTISAGEVMSGVLQAKGRAVVVGHTTSGNMEALLPFDLPDGAVMWLATETFTAEGQTYGPWEDTGIRPDVAVSARWDLFTEADDPAFAAAVDALLD